MAKVLRVVATVVAIAAAIPTGGTSLLGAFTGISATAAAALSIGLSFAAQLTAKKPSLQGGQTEWRSDPTAPIPVVFGETLVGGSIIYRKVDGVKKNKYQFIGSVLSGCGPIEGITSTLVDKDATTFSGGNAVGALAGRVYQASQLGACPEASALALAGPWGSLPDWGASHKLSGLAAVMNAFVFDGKGSITFTQVPKIQHVIKGVKCYDPRLDSTFPGGSGTCRAADQTTWVWSENPWIQALTWAIGWRQGPDSIRVGGVGQAVDTVDVAAFAEAANVADANGWKSGGSVSTADDKWQVLKALCQAGGGEPVRLGAWLSCTVNTPRVPIATITLDDLAGTVQATTTQTRRDRVNGIVPKYRSEDHTWEKVLAGVVRSATALAEDGGIERTREVDYLMVQCRAGDTPDQAAQLAGYDIVNAREAGPVVLPLKPRWLGFRAGDCLEIANDPRWRSLAGKRVLVLRRQFDPEKGNVVLTVRTEDPDKHAWALGLTGTAAPVTGAASTRPLPEAPDAGDWTVTTHIESMEGLPTGTIQIDGGVDDASAWFVLVEYREHGAADWVQSGWLPISAVSHEIIGLSVARRYDVAISYFQGERLIFSDLGFETRTADTTEITADNGFLTADRA